MFLTQQEVKRPLHVGYDLVRHKRQVNTYFKLE